MQEHSSKTRRSTTAWLTTPIQAYVTVNATPGVDLVLSSSSKIKVEEDIEQAHWESSQDSRACVQLWDAMGKIALGQLLTRSGFELRFGLRGGYHGGIHSYLLNELIQERHA